MKKIIDKKILPNGVVILTMNNPEVNNNVTWKAVEDLYLEIKESREIVSLLNDDSVDSEWLFDTTEKWCRDPVSYTHLTLPTTPYV